VAQAAVIAREDGPGAGKQLMGYVVPAPGAVLDAAALRRGLAQRLPEHMVPAAIVLLEALPLTANGKLDRRALPVPVLGVPRQADIATPESPMERLVAGIWESVLGVEQIDIYENFFDLGGNSLLIISVQAQLQKNTGLEINIVDFFRFTTVSSLASHLDHLQNSPVAAPQKDGEHRLVRDRIEKQKETTRRAAAWARERKQLPTEGWARTESINERPS